ncbi:MAG: DUF3054 domain-containing protein [Acidimicrobiia bacterium]|nr:DUF3054 domain-containing protein [Acidimicrobiia bacterium]
MRYLFTLDLVAVIAFVVIGRDTHNATATLSGTLEVALPFLVGAAVGWLATRAWRRPAAFTTGLGVVAATVVVGMVLRRFAFDSGTDPVFILVATAFLALMMLGWRLVVLAVLHRRRATVT